MSRCAALVARLACQGGAMVYMLLGPILSDPSVKAEGDEICGRADTQRRAGSPAAAQLCPEAGPIVTLAALRRHMNRIRMDC